MRFEKYSPERAHLLAAFDCGNEVINAYAHDVMGTDADDGVNFEPMGGTVNIAYLALDKEYHHLWLGRNRNQRNFYFGDMLLSDCERRIRGLSRDLGISFVTIYSSEEGYHMYHDRNDYEDFEEDMNTVVHDSDAGCRRLYKWVGDIADPDGGQ